MCFALARLAKFVVFAALYLLAVMAAGTIYSGLSSHMFYAGPVCFVLFMSLFLLKTTMLRACKRFILRKRIQLTSFEIVCFAATCVVMCAQIGFAWWHVSAKDAWVIAVCWGLFFMGALGTSSDASEQFEHILPCCRRIVVDKRFVDDCRGTVARFDASVIQRTSVASVHSAVLADRVRAKVRAKLIFVVSGKVRCTALTTDTTGQSVQVSDTL